MTTKEAVRKYRDEVKYVSLTELQLHQVLETLLWDVDSGEDVPEVIRMAWMLEECSLIAPHERSVLEDIIREEAKEKEGVRHGTEDRMDRY